MPAKKKAAKKGTFTFWLTYNPVYEECEAWTSRPTSKKAVCGSCAGSTLSFTSRGDRIQICEDAVETLIGRRVTANECIEVICQIVEKIA